MTPDERSWNLHELPGCFDGVIPPMLATCSASGEPNVTHLSQLTLIDADHLAVSNQFFGKTSVNLAENPMASVLVTCSQTYATYRIGVRFERTETEGPLFEQMRSDLEAISVLMHMEDVFVLRGADVYEVSEVEALSATVNP